MVLMKFNKSSVPALILFSKTPISVSWMATLALLARHDALYEEGEARWDHPEPERLIDCLWKLHNPNQTEMCHLDHTKGLMKPPKWIERLSIHSRLLQL